MIWKFFAWISIACGLVAYFIGWIALLSRSVVWGVPTEFWFYDAIAAGIFGLFFLIYAVHADKKERQNES